MLVLELVELGLGGFDLLEVFLELYLLLGLFLLQHLLVLALFDALLVAFHDDGDEDVLHCGVEQHHEDYEVDLPREALGPCLQEGVIHNVTIQQREQRDDR